MKTKSSVLALLSLLMALSTTGVLRAGESSPTGKLVAPTADDAAWLNEARAAYPLKTCVVSAEPLGGMGISAEFIYREANRPDRLVRFCCKMCVRTFKKAPAKYLAQLPPPAETGPRPEAATHP
jgi:hypothetical protein